MRDWFLSHTHNSFLFTQPLTSPKFTSPICIRVVGAVGSVEKVLFVSLFLATEHLIVLVHDIVDIIDTVAHVSERVCRLTSESCPARARPSAGMRTVRGNSSFILVTLPCLTMKDLWQVLLLFPVIWLSPRTVTKKRSVCDAVWVSMT